MCENNDRWDEIKIVYNFILYGIIIIILMTIVFFGFIYFMDQKLYSFSNFQETGNFISSTFAIAVSLAGSIVAIYLASASLKITKTLDEDQKNREQKQIILAKIQKTRDITVDVIESYYEIAFNIYNFVVKINEPAVRNKLNVLIKEMNNLENNIVTSPSPSNKMNIELYDEYKKELDFILPEFKQVIISSNDLCDSIIEIHKDIFTYQVYHQDFKRKMIKTIKHKDNFFVNSKDDLINLTFQIKAYTHDFTTHYLLNLVAHILSKDYSPEDQRDFFVAIALGYFTAPHQTDDERIELVGSVLIYDIFSNLPTVDKIKKVLESCEKNSYAATLVDQIFCSADNIKLFTDEMQRIREKIIDNFESTFEYDLLYPYRAQLEEIEKKITSSITLEDKKTLLFEIKYLLENNELPELPKAKFISYFNELYKLLKDE